MADDGAAGDKLAATANKSSTLRKKTRSSFKTYLTSPFRLPLPALEREASTALLDSFLALPLPPKFSLGEREQARRAAKRAKAKAAASDKGKGAAAAAASRSPASSVVVCGVNEVTRGLEQQRLGLVLLARSAGPPMLVNHLLAQAFAQGVPICAVTGLSEALAPRIGARNLVCLGITKDAASGDGVFAALAKDVARLAPTPNLPWLLRPPASGQPPQIDYLPLRTRKVEANPKRTAPDGKGPRSAAPSATPSASAAASPSDSQQPKKKKRVS